MSGSYLSAPTLSSTLSTASILYGGNNTLTSIEQNTIIEKLKELHKLLSTCEEERQRNEQILENITKTQERMQNDAQKLYYKQKLKTLQKSAIEGCDFEVNYYNEALNLIFEVKDILKRPRKLIPYRNHLQLSSNSNNSGGFAPKEHSIRRGALMKLLHQQAQTLPLFIPFSRDDKPPALCGSIPAEPNYVGKIGDMVAALVKSTEGDENWILAEIVNYNSNTGKYEIDDIDEEQKERHILSKRKIIPLPLYRANPETHPYALWPRKSVVLALYPQTTCFYRAIVQEQPKTATDQYKVLFEDSSYQEGFSPPLPICQRFIIKSSSKKKLNHFS